MTEKTDITIDDLPEDIQSNIIKLVDVAGKSTQSLVKELNEIMKYDEIIKKLKDNSKYLQALYRLSKRYRKVPHEQEEEIVRKKDITPIIYNGEKGFIEAGKVRPATLKEQKEPIWRVLNIPVYEEKKTDLKQLYEDAMNVNHKLFVLNNEIEYKIYTLWNLATWLQTYFDTISFLSFISMHDTGKTRLLIGIVKTGNKAILASSSTAAVIPRLSDKYGIIVLVDEAHNLKADADLYTFCKSSYKRGSYYLKAKGDTDDEFIALDNFGFKAFAGEKGFRNFALSSRCIDISPMKAVPEVQKFKYVAKMLDSIRDRSLIFSTMKFEEYDLGNDYRTLTGRTRELFEPLIVVAKMIGIPYDDVEEYAKEQELAKRREMSSTVAHSILEYIKDQIENIRDIKKIRLYEVINWLSWPAKIEEERRKSGARLGYELKPLNINVEGQGFYDRYIDMTDEDTRKNLENLFVRFDLQDIPEKEKPVKKLMLKGRRIQE